MSRWVSLNQARAKASLNASWSLRNFSEIARNSGSILQRHVGGGHHRRHALADGSCAAGAMSSGFWLIGCHCCAPAGRLHQLVFIVEQQAEIILRPLGRRVDPRALDAAGDGVLADAALVARWPSRSPAARCRRPRARRRPGSASPSPCALPKVWPPAVSATVSSWFIAMRSKVTLMSRADCSGSGLPPGPFGIDVDQAHLDRRERMLELHARARAGCGSGRPR